MQKTHPNHQGDSLPFYTIIQGAKCQIKPEVNDMADIRIAAAYIRVSTDDQTEYSPAAQKRELLAYAATHNLLLDERYIYADEGISGRRAEKRPAFMRMIADAKSPDHPFDVILVHKFDRFARSREDSIVYKSMLKRVGVEVVSIKEPLAEGNYSGVMEAIYESFAEAYSINLGQEVKKGMKEKALRGEVQTAPPFGYRLNNHIFVPDETEAPIVRELFSRFLTGESLFALAKDLNTRGITTHRGNRFENRTIEYILRNPVYIGKLRWNPTGRSRRNFDDPNILTVDGKHNPIVDLDIYEQVQARIAEQKARWRYHARPSYDRKHWLSGIVRCAACGTTLIWSKPHYLKCSNYVRGRCRHSQHIAAEAISEAFIKRLQGDLLSAQELQCRLIRPKDGAETKLQIMRRDIQRIEAKITRLTDAYLNSALHLEEYKNLKEALDAELTTAQNALQAAESASPTPDTGKALRSAIETTLRTLVSSTATTEEKYTAVSTIIDTCTFDKSTLTLTLSYRISI